MESEYSFSDEKHSVTTLGNPSEQMFLLECQVKRVLISSPDLRLRLGSDDLILCENTRLTLTFMNYPEIELCENEDEEKKLFGCTTPEPTCGKSCLFALSEKQLLPFMNPPVPPCSFSVQIRLYALDSLCGDNPSRMLVGCCAIPMGELFSDMLNQSDDIMDAPVTCVTKQDFPITDTTGTEVGSIFACVRVSCFGKMILAPISVGTPSKKAGMTDVMHLEAENTTCMSEGSGEGPCDGLPIFREDAACRKHAGSDSCSDFVDAAKTRAYRPESEEDWMEGLGFQTSGRAAREMQRAPEVPVTREPEFTYEEIRAAVNGHTLFFKILKKGKKPAEDTPVKVPAIEAPVSVDSRRCSAAKKCSRRDEVDHKEDNRREERQRPAQRVPGSFCRDARRSLQAKAEGAGGYRVAVDSEWEKQLRSEEADGVINDPKAELAAERDVDENKLRESKSKEVFSISVGQQVMLDGEVRPKLVLEIRAPKTKEDLDAEEAAIDAAEDRQKRRADRKKASALVSDATQYAPSDLGTTESPDSNNDQQGGGKKGKKDKRKKGKK